ncbi:HAD family hydrolase [Yinghuangia seranimata]|uniref:HAD family hydrolase n=1 Tax=Yinghuangia seranimata TaxID=408067 RepID=UPI00248C469B|nr:HAD family phosphatase [Yinghuangia seranimata]MDI2126632.1 HAD family phosphatase [Yinghuangia seranimata]
MTALDTGTQPAPDLEAVLCDMDGTLVDTERSWFATEVSVMADLGFQLGPEHAPRLLGSPMEPAVTYLLGVSGVDIAPLELERRINERMVEILSSGVDLRPGAKRLLADLDAAGVPLALVTASYRAIVDAVLPSLGAHHFSVTVAGDEVERPKPAPDPYLTAAAGLGVDPAHCVVLEDSPTGVASGEAAGCVVVAVPSMTDIPAGPRRTVVQSLEGVDLGLLEALVRRRTRR